MRVFLCSALLLLGTSILQITNASNPLNVQVTLRGKKYTIPNVSTVRDLQKSVEDQSGLSSSKQGVLFGGKKLKPGDVLEDVGVEDGSVINIVPSSGKKKSSSGSSVASAAAAATTANGASASSANGGGASSGAGAGGGGLDGMMESMLKEAGLDKDKFDDLLKQMPGGGGADGGGMPNMKESMEMMQNMMNSPLFQEYMNDPEKLEQSRQMILNNPMMKSMMGGMPGFEEILNDREKWRETMQAAASMYKDMDMGAMMNAMGGLGAGAGAGGFGGMPNLEGFAGMGSSGSGAASGSALDELSEGED